jgi:antitoxin ParD1/3/4
MNDRSEKAMRITLTKELESLVKEKVRSGRYADESDVLRDALRALEQRDDFESPALEAALIQGARSSHRLYNKRTLDRIRKGAN